MVLSVFNYQLFLAATILLLLQAQQSVDLIQSKIVKAAGDTTVIENSDVSPEMVCIFFNFTSLGYVNYMQKKCVEDPSMT